MIQYSNLIISGTLAVTDGIAGSIASASYASTASYLETASYATSALSSSYATSSSISVTASFATSASWALSSSYALSSSFATSASSATSASWTTTASFATTASWSTTASFATSASRAVTASFAHSSSLAVSASYLINTVYDREIHVSNVSGHDSGSGTLLQPVKTIARAFALLQSNGAKVVIHPGTYREDVVLTDSNATISPSTPEQGGIVFVSGSFTINNNGTSNRITGITANHWVVTGSGAAYFDQIKANQSFTKLGSGYMEVLNSGLQPSQGITITAGTNIFSGGNLAGILQSGATTQTIVKSALALSYVNITQGTFAATDTPIFPITSGSAAIVSSPGTVVQLFNTQISTLAGEPERIQIGGFFGYDNIFFNRAISTLGTQLGLTADFQNIRGTLIGTASLATTASFTVSASIARTASYVESSSYAAYAVTASYLSGSVTVDTSSLVTTASFNAFTSSVATTGSNQFQADQIITGSLIIGSWRMLESGSNLSVEKWDGSTWIQSGYFEI